MFKDNKDFYPTPKSLIHKMLQDTDLRKTKTILEPSAGKGDIAEEIINRIKALSNKYYNNNNNKYDVDCIEIDENLRYILQGKGFRVIHDDFLTYDCFKRYDLIIANFPFSEGDKHLSKALQLIENGGQLICLINAETLKNPYSNLRKDLVRKLSELNANIEYLQEEFINAERHTNVEVALIKIKATNINKESIILKRLKQEEQYRHQDNHLNNTLIEGDFIKGIIQQYQFEIKIGLNLINEYYNLQPLTIKTFKHDKYSGSILNLSIDGSKYDDDIKNDNLINAYIKKVRYKYWEALFNNEQFTVLLTSNLLKEYRQKINELQDYDFSYYNIKEIQKQMSQGMIKGVEDTIFNLFEEFSHKYSWFGETGKNIHYYNGWKTNSAYKINKRVIIPLCAYSSITNKLDYSYKFYDKLKDIERVFNYLDGGNTEEQNLKEILDKAQNEKQTKNIKTKYFSINTYKKGTTHLTFLNEELLAKFNLFGSMKKNWLPPSYGKAKYDEMTKEEQKIIDEYEGKEQYNRVIKNLDYYLYNPSKILMLQE